MEYALFQKLVREGEKGTVDFKIDAHVFATGAVADRGELAKDICSLANNGSRKSYILIGVSDDGRHFKSFSNAKLTDDALQDFCKNAIHPPPRVKFTLAEWAATKAAHAGKRFGIIEVGPHPKTAFRLSKDFMDYSNKACYRKNEVWIRRGATCDLATPEEIAGLLRKPGTDPTIHLPNNVIYQRLPVTDQREQVLSDLAAALYDLGGSLADGDAALPLQKRQHVWRVAVVSELNSQRDLFELFRDVWEYQHGVLVISLGTVGKSSIPQAADVSTKEAWGYYVRLNLALRYFLQRLEILDRGVRGMAPFSVPLVVLSSVRDSQTLRTRLIDAVDFLNQHAAELSVLQASRKALNTNLQKLLETGWLELVEYVYDGDERKLRKGEFLSRDGHREAIYRASWPGDMVRNVGRILSLSGAKVPKRKR